MILAWFVAAAVIVGIGWYFRALARTAERNRRFAEAARYAKIQQDAYDENARWWEERRKAQAAKVTATTAPAEYPGGTALRRKITKLKQKKTMKGKTV